MLFSLSLLCIKNILKQQNSKSRPDFVDRFYVITHKTDELTQIIHISKRKHISTRIILTLSLVLNALPEDLETMACHMSLSISADLQAHT